MSSEITVIGSIAIDLVCYVEKLPKTGETVFGRSFETNFGGKGANQAVQCARLGVNVSIVGCVGKDTYGDNYVNNFISEGVNSQCINRSDFSTGIASINVADGGSNTIVVIPGANSSVSIDTVESVEDLIRGSKVILCQNEIPKQVTLRALSIARSHDVISIFNPAPAENISSLKELISTADIVCPNETELSILTSLSTDTNENIEIAARQLLAIGCRIVIVTLGENGVCIITNISCEFIPAINVQAIDTVGAGDAFLGTLAANLSRGDSIRNAVLKGLHCAGISVTRKGAQRSFVRYDELDNSHRPDIQRNNEISKQTLLNI